MSAPPTTTSSTAAATPAKAAAPTVTEAPPSPEKIVDWGAQVPVEAALVDPRSVDDLPPQGGDDKAYDLGHAGTGADAERQKAVMRKLGTTGEEMIGGGDLEAIAKRREKARKRLENPIPISFVLKCSKEKLEGRKLSNELFFFLPFFALFLTYSFLLRDVPAAYWQSAQLGGQAAGGQFPTLESTRALKTGEVEYYHISYDFFMITNARDWHMWFETQIVSFFWDRTNSSSYQVDDNYVQGWNLKLGAMRVRTIRVTNQSCHVNPGYQTHPWNPNSDNPFENHRCYSEWSRSKVDRTDYGSPTVKFPFYECKDRGRFIQAELGFYPCDGNVFDIPFYYSLDNATAMARSLDEQYNGGVDILDPTSVRFIAVEFFTYNPSSDMFLSVKAIIEISSSGKFIPYVYTVGFQVYSQKQLGLGVLWAFVWCMAFLSIGKYLFEWAKAVCKGKGVSYFFTPWNLLDFLLYSVLIIMFVTRLIWWKRSSDLSFKIPFAEDHYRDELDYISWLFLFQIYGSAVAVILFFLKILKFVELNPQLNIVTRTLGAAAQNLLGILIIFLVILVAFTLSGIAIFCAGVEDYRDFASAFIAILRMLLGDFDYPQLREEQPYLAGLFFWAFVILGLFLLLNFFIGVIGASFNEQAEATKGEPLHETIARFFSGVWNSMLDFCSNPGAYCHDAAVNRGSEFAKAGRLSTFVELLSTYRHSLPIGASAQEIAAMSEEERESLQPDPQIKFADIRDIFTQAAPDGEERYEWVGDRYMQTLWLDYYRQYRVEGIEEEIAEAERLTDRIQESTEESLRFVLGIKVGSTHTRISEEVAAIQDLFAPAARTLKTVGEMRAKVDSLEGHVVSMLKAVTRLDQQLSVALKGK